MPNPYQTPTGDAADPRGNTASRIRTPSRFLIAIHSISIILVIAMCLGGMVTYAPNVTQYEMQNIYLTEMLWFSSGLVILQIVGLVLVIRMMRLATETH